MCRAVRAMFHRQVNVRFHRATVVGFDRDGRHVDLADSDRLRFDYITWDRAYRLIIEVSDTESLPSASDDT